MKSKEEIAASMLSKPWIVPAYVPTEHDLAPKFDVLTMKMVELSIDILEGRVIP